ncbi:MAG: hypothetical protein K1X94_31795 [Sandaracinaceae bacterium]|nr:hypothetical protein [Sandaracinaceae bacterium]
MVDPPSPVLGVLLGPRFDRCTVAECSDTREGYLSAATLTAEADLAIALLPTLLAHDPAGSACRGEVQELTVGSDRLRVERTGGRVRLHAPAWLGDPEPLAELPCTEASPVSTEGS